MKKRYERFGMIRRCISSGSEKLLMAGKLRGLTRFIALLLLLSGAVFFLPKVGEAGEPSAATSTALASGMNPAAAGESVTFTATVTSGTGTPTGSVTFSEGSTTHCAAAALSNGSAQCGVSSLAIGDHTITATYGGDTGYLASISAPVIQSIVTALSFTSDLGSVTIEKQLCLPAPSGLVGWWTGDGNTSDLSGNGNNGTALAGLEYQSGKSDSAFYFNGTNTAGVHIPASSSLNVQSYTFQAWIRPTADLGMPVLEWSSAGIPGVHLWLYTSVDTVYLNAKSASGADHGYSLPGSITVNAWNHLAATYDQASGTVALYVNGAFGGSFVVGTYAPGTNYDLYIGNRPGWANAFAGLIDEVQVYNRALAADEILELYNADSAGICRAESDVRQSRVIGGVPPYTWSVISGDLPPGLFLNPTTGVFTGKATALGTWEFTVQVSDKDGRIATRVYSLTVGKISTTTTIASGTNPTTHGQSVTFTATVTSGATGTIVFKDGVVSLGSSTLSSGHAVFSTSSLDWGTHSITAEYGGNETYQGSTSTPVSQQVKNLPPFFTGTPSITGIIAAGRTLRLLNLGTNDPEGDPVTLSYQWQADGADIEGATAATYLITAPDHNVLLTCLIAANSVGGTAFALTDGVWIMKKQVSAGNSQSCGLNTDGTVACWGLHDGGVNDEGQATAPAGKYTQVSSGGNHNLALTSDGTITSWGTNYYGESSPPAGTFTQVSAGEYFTCGLMTNATITCWGHDGWGLTAPAVDFVQVSTGSTHGCGLGTDGTISCWGNNYNGQAASSSEIFTQVSAGGYHTCGLKLNGTISCWGNNYNGQASPPVAVFTQVSAGGYHTCGIKSNHTVSCWGLNDDGQASPPAGTFTQLSAGYQHTCGLRTDGAIACWGYNVDGQAPVISISPETLPNATYGMSYTQILTAGSGTPPYKMKILTGSLPTGLTLSSSGTISGITMSAATYTFTVEAMDANSIPFTGVRTYSLMIDRLTSAITVTSTINPSEVGRTATFTAKVTTGATGTVVFKDNSTILGSATLSASKAIFSTSSLPWGGQYGHYITAEYTGNNKYSGSISEGFYQQVYNVSPVFNSVPAITGTPELGCTLSVLASTSTDPYDNWVTLSYQWKADGVNIAGANNDSFTITADQLERTITCVVTANDSRGGTAVATTAGAYVDVPVPNPPSVTGITPTNNTRPTWTWTSGGGTGIGTYRRQLDGGAWVTVTGLSFRPAAALASGSHTLLVQEQNSTGRWSYSGVMTIDVDLDGPVIDLSMLPDGAITNNWVLNIAGSAYDQNAAVNTVSVEVNGELVGEEPAIFNAAALLRPGANTVAITALDYFGNETVETRTITYDAKAPVLVVAAPSDHGTAYGWLLEVAGRKGVGETVEVIYNGNVQPVLVSGLAFTAEVDLGKGLSPFKTIVVTATNATGSTNSVKRTVVSGDLNINVTMPAEDAVIMNNSMLFKGTVADAPPGATVSILAGGQTYTAAIIAGAFSRTVIFPAEGVYPVFVSVRDHGGNLFQGTVQRNIIYYTIVSPTALLFNKHLVGTASTIRKVVVENTGEAPLIITGIAFGGANPGQFAKTSTCPINGAGLISGAACTINVSFKPTTSGVKSASLKINVAGPATSQVVALSGTGVAPIALLSKTAIAFGNQLVSTVSTTRTLTVSNTGSALLVISDISLSGANPGQFATSTTCPIGSTGLATGETCTVSVTFKPASVDAKSASLVISLAAPATTKTVALTGIGVAPVTLVSSTTISFGSLLVSKTSTTRIVAVSNAGTAPLFITGINLNGANPGQFSKTTTCSTGTTGLASGATCTISVRFKPTTAGAKKASLAINVVAPALPKTVALTGTGL